MKTNEREQAMSESVCALSREADLAFSFGDLEKGLQVYREIEEILLCNWLLRQN